MKAIYSGVFLLICLMGSAQEQKEIKGKITVPTATAAGGVAIYNLSSGDGTVSRESGGFTIDASVGDTLILTALQMEKLKLVITEEIYGMGRFQTEMFLLTNRLAEVFISDHNLSGNLRSDIGKITVITPDFPTQSAAELKKYETGFPSGPQSPLTNAAMGTGIQQGNMNIIKMIGTAVNLIGGLFPKKVEPVKYSRVSNVRDELLELLEEEFFTETLMIEKDRLNEFFNFVGDHGLSNRFFEKGKELDLIEMLVKLGAEFRERNDTNPSELPRDPKLPDSVTIAA